MLKHFYFKQFRLALVRSLNVKSVLFQAIQFSIATLLSFTWAIDRTLSSATTPGQSEPGSDDNEGVLCTPQSSSFTGTLLSDCLVSYPTHSLRGYPSAERESKYSTAPAYCAVTELLVMHYNTWKHLTVCKQMINSKLNYSY